jgi:hypothetical protein
MARLATRLGHMRRPRFCQSIKLGTAAWLLALIVSTPSRALADSGRVVARPAQTFRGWGMSLAWEANDLYGGGRQPAQIRDPNIQSRYMDLLYGDPPARLTLGFTIARFNIAGGDDPAHKHMRADAQMEGFQRGPMHPSTGRGTLRSGACCKGMGVMFEFLIPGVEHTPGDPPAAA